MQWWRSETSIDISKYLKVLKNIYAIAVVGEEEKVFDKSISKYYKIYIYMSLQWSVREKKYLIEEKEDDLLPPLMPPPVVKFEL